MLIVGYFWFAGGSIVHRFDCETNVFFVCSGNDSISIQGKDLGACQYILDVLCLCLENESKNLFVKLI